MNYLLDTHTLFWLATDTTRLPDNVLSIIADERNVIGVSIASFWEMGIKSSIGKWSLPMTLIELGRRAADEDIKIIPITLEATEVIRTLPLHHGDPFDRVIIATAVKESAAILSIDAKFDEYVGVQRIWS